MLDGTGYGLRMNRHGPERRRRHERETLQDHALLAQVSGCRRYFAGFARDTNDDGFVRTRVVDTHVAELPGVDGGGRVRAQTREPGQPA